MTRRQSLEQALSDMNIVTAGAVSTFSMMGLLVTGLLGEAVTYLENHPSVAVVATLVTLLICWASSDTRSPTRYHMAELVIVFGSVGLVVLHGFWDPAEQFVTQHNPYTGGVVVAIMTLAGGITAN